MDRVLGKPPVVLSHLEKLIVTVVPNKPHTWVGVTFEWEIAEVPIGPHVAKVGSVDVRDGVNSRPESSDEDVRVGVSVPELAETPGGSVKKNVGQTSLETEGVGCWHGHFVVTDVLAWDTEVDDFGWNFWVALFQINHRSGCRTIILQ